MIRTAVISVTASFLLMRMGSQSGQLPPGA